MPQPTQWELGWLRVSYYTIHTSNRGLKRKHTLAYRYVAPPGERYYNTLLCCIFHCWVWYRTLSLHYACIRSSGIILILYTTFVPNFFRSLHCWASPWRKIAYSITQSLTPHPACEYFSSSSVVSRAFSALCVYSKFGHHCRPLGYLCAKLRFFPASIAELVHREKSRTQSFTHSLFDATGTKALVLWNIYNYFMFASRMASMIPACPVKNARSTVEYSRNRFRSLTFLNKIS